MSQLPPPRKARIRILTVTECPCGAGPACRCRAIVDESTQLIEPAFVTERRNARKRKAAHVCEEADMVVESSHVVCNKCGLVRNDTPLVQDKRLYEEAAPSASSSSSSSFLRTNASSLTYGERSNSGARFGAEMFAQDTDSALRLLDRASGTVCELTSGKEARAQRHEESHKAKVESATHDVIESRAGAAVVSDAINVLNHNKRRKTVPTPVTVAATAELLRDVSSREASGVAMATSEAVTLNPKEVKREKAKLAKEAGIQYRKVLRQAEAEVKLCGVESPATKSALGTLSVLAGSPLSSIERGVEAVLRKVRADMPMPLISACRYVVRQATAIFPQIISRTSTDTLISCALKLALSVYPAGEWKLTDSAIEQGTGVKKVTIQKHYRESFAVLACFLLPVLKSRADALTAVSSLKVKETDAKRIAELCMQASIEHGKFYAAFADVVAYQKSFLSLP